MKEIFINLLLAPQKYVHSTYRTHKSSYIRYNKIQHNIKQS